MSKSRKRKTPADLLARERELLVMMDTIDSQHRPRYLKRQLKAVRAKIRRISNESIGVSI